MNKWLIENKTLILWFSMVMFFIIAGWLLYFFYGSKIIQDIYAARMMQPNLKLTMPYQSAYYAKAMSGFINYAFIALIFIISMFFLLAMRFKKKILSFRLPFLLISSLLLILISLHLFYKIYFDTGEASPYVAQAAAFLQGKLYLPGSFCDAAYYKGHYYMLSSPTPSFVFLPVVALVGEKNTKTILASLLFCLLNIYLLTRILKKLGIEIAHIRWLIAAFFFGTGYWSIAESGYGTNFDHLLVIPFLFLAINEILGRNRGIFAGIFLGIAFLSRPIVLYSFFFILVGLWTNPSPNNTKDKLANVFGFIFSFSLFVGIYLFFNWIRFGNIFDSGLSHLIYTGYMKERIDMFGNFNPVYIPYNFYLLFLKGFSVEFSPPLYVGGMLMDILGTSLTFASPFVFFSFWAKWNKNLLIAAWASICAEIIHILLFAGNGGWQINSQRYALDFLPILILLVALGIKNVREDVWKPAIIYSIILNILALYIIPLCRIIEKIVS